MNILVHTSFIGNTGYNNHARSFFTALNKYHNVKVRNYTVGETWSHYYSHCHDKEPYMTDEMRGMLILQSLHNPNNTVTDYPLYNYDGSFKPDVNIILNDVNHRYFYDNYEGYTIGYNVWETTEYPQDFFNQILKFDEFWVPSEWQKNNLIKQGYPEHKIFVVPEGVDGETFFPEKTETEEYFKFLLFGRWEYRKSTKEIIKTFSKTFNESEKVKLIVSADNPYANDGFKTTEERLNFSKLNHKNIEVIHFPKRDKYIQYLKDGNVFVSCARSEGWNLPLIEAMACGTPSIYSNWGAQLEFAKGLGIPVKTLHEVPASNQEKHFVGNYIQPDYDDLSKKMREVYENYDVYKLRAIKESQTIREKFNWDKIAEKASDRLNKLSTEEKTDWVFVTTGNEKYMPIIEKLVKSINEFSKHKIIVYGVDCDVPFDSPCLIKKRLSVPYHSEHDKWYWKQYACIESIKERYKHYVWIDGDVIVNYNIDTIEKYFDFYMQYPLSDVHVQEEFVGFYDNGKSQLFNENLCELYGGICKNLRYPFDHACLYIYDESCQWFFEKIIEIYKEIPLNEYKKYLLWNDEGIHNLLKWKHNSVKKLPLSNFDVSGYDGDNGDMKTQLQDFYTFWEREGPYNFGRIYGYQYIPKDKSQILYFHGNKNSDVSDRMIEFIKFQRDNNFYKSEYFWSIDGELKNLGLIKNAQGGVMDIANQYGWDYAIYHEIYNLQDYYHNRIKRIQDGDIVVDLGGNIGIFNRWAYSQGAGLVISFEPDKRYFKLLSKNSDPRSLLFNAAMSDTVGTTNIFESNHLGGSNMFVSNTTNIINYPIRTYTLDYLFESNLVDRIDFLKIDTEGAEQLILNGISDENLMKIKNISMEYHHAHLGFNEIKRDNMIQRLNKLGFNSYLLFLGTNNQLQMLYFWR
jgi:FkbM family methyltransferase